MGEEIIGIYWQNSTICNEMIQTKRVIINKYKYKPWSVPLMQIYTNGWSSSILICIMDGFPQFVAIFKYQWYSEKRF